MRDNQVLWEDEYLIAVYKPSTLPVQPDKTGNNSLLKVVKRYCKSNIYLINRLDRPASGVVLFAKRKSIAAALTEQLKNRTVIKTYLAVTPKTEIAPKNKLIHHIRKDGKTNRSFAFDKPLHHTQKAELDYEIIASIERYQLLKINLITGRHHQIRAQLSALKSPIKGDVKYGFKRGNRDRSIHLHAWKIQFEHPFDNYTVEVEAPLPDDTVWQAFDF